MDIEVNFTTTNFTTELNTQSTLEVYPQITVTRLQDLVDFDSNSVNDKYVMVYDAASQKYKMVNPDDVLNYAAGTETIQPGLVGYATTFIDRLDTDLDDKIDLDAGSF